MKMRSYDAIKTHKHTNKHFPHGRRKALGVAIAGALAASSGVLEAQVQNVEEVIVTGIRGSLSRSMDVKREAKGIVDAISAEDIGKFPDLNVAESLQRITGVSIDRSGGEGQFVTVRGFGPQFNTVLINGRQVATENPGREFSFDVLAAELISGTTVHKSPTADMQEGGIGATINVTTARPFAIDGFKFAGSAKALYDELSEDTSPQLSGLVSNTFADDTVGLLLAVSYQEREVQENIIETRYYRPLDTMTIGSGEQFVNVFVPQNFDQIVDLQDRERLNASGVLQFALAEDIELTFDTFISEFEVDSERHALGHWFSESNFLDVELDENRTVVFIDNADTGATDFIRSSAGRDVSLQNFGANLDWMLNDEVTATFDLSYSSAEDSSGGNIPFTVVGYNNAYQWDNRAGGDYPSIAIEGGQAALLDRAAGRVHYNERNGWDREDTITEFKVDFAWTPDRDTITEINYGVYYQDREKDNQRRFASACSLFCGYETDFDDNLLTEFTAENYFSGVPNRWLTYDTEAYFDYIGSTGVDLIQDRILNDGDPSNDDRNIAAEYAAIGIDNPATAADKFRVEEEVISAYIAATLAGEWGDLPWELNLGFRYSRTNSELGGFVQTLADLVPIPNDPSDLDEVYADEGRDVAASNSYANLLPSINWRFDLSDDVVFRTAYSKTLTRPTMDQLSPTTVVTVSRPNNNQASGGNPNLKPFLSTNIDASIEWYYTEDSFLAAAVFNKEVEDFIVNQVAIEQFPVATYDADNDGTPDGTTDFSVSRPQNGEEASVNGIELALTHIWDFGLGIQVNATAVDSDAQIDINNVATSFALEGLGDSQNFVLFYESGPLQARVAFNNREGFLQNLINPRGGTEPLFTETYGQWDLSASFDITDSVTVFIEGINITGEETRRHGRFKNQLVSFEDTGSRYSLGVRANF